MSTANHVIAVLESTECRCSLTTASAVCSALGKNYRKPYPEGIIVNARLTQSKTVFTMTGHARYVEWELAQLAGTQTPGVGTTFTIDGIELKVKSATITPPPKKPQSQPLNVDSTDNGYAQMFDFMYKMASLSMQAFDS